MRALRAVGALSALVMLFGVLAAGAPRSGAAAAASQCGNTAASPSLSVDRPTIGVDETAVVTVTARSYLLPPHVCGTDVFGGIYLFFGWVQPGGQWGPSHKSSTSTQGLFGTTYSYPGEGGGAETRDDGTGTIRLVSFTPGGESGTSTPFHMDGQGNWQSTLTVRGATYGYRDLRTGATRSVDCRAVQCGVFTIGAHGKASRTNEVFTPITFVDRAGTPIVPDDGATAGSAAPSAPASGGTVATGPVEGVATPDGSASAAAETTVAPSTTTPGAGSDTGPTAGADGTADARAVDARETAAVQDFGDDGAGAPPLVLVVGVLGLATTAVALVLRRRRRTAGAR